MELSELGFEKLSFNYNYYVTYGYSFVSSVSVMYSEDDICNIARYFYVVKTFLYSSNVYCS